MKTNVLVISEAIACVGRLKGLWISDNCLKSLPLNLAKVKTLEVLDVEESEKTITTVTNGPSDCKRLLFHFSKRNYLTVIPDKIKQLPRLREFSYSGNSTVTMQQGIFPNQSSFRPKLIWKCWKITRRQLVSSWLKRRKEDSSNAILTVHCKTLVNKIIIFIK